MASNMFLERNDHPLKKVEDKGSTAWYIRSNLITHGKASNVFYPKHGGLLSIKFNLKGQATYEFDRARLTVNEKVYFLLNEGQSYSSHIQSETEVEYLSVFFSQEFAREVRASFQKDPHKLLDEPGKPSAHPVEFFERLYPHDRTVTPYLIQIHNALGKGMPDPDFLHEDMHCLLASLLQVHHQTQQDADAFPSVRRSTRTELYRRLHLAKDFIDSNFSERLSLSMIANMAYLSEHHFLRLFKKTFNETPHQYITRKRLELAKKLILTTEQPITDICMQVGFENPSSFTRLFRQRVGLTPESYRRENRSMSR
jgi:AraC family transcriptional regulator